MAIAHPRRSAPSVARLRRQCISGPSPAVSAGGGLRGLLGPHFRPEDVYVGNLLGRLEALDSGITTLLDWSHIMNSPEHADAAIAALLDAGARSIFAYGNGNAEWATLPSATPHSP